MKLLWVALRTVQILKSASKTTSQLRTTSTKRLNNDKLISVAHNLVWAEEVLSYNYSFETGTSIKIMWDDSKDSANSKNCFKNQFPVTYQIYEASE